MADREHPLIEELRRKGVGGDPAALAPLARALDQADRSIEATDLLSTAANKGSAEARFLVGTRLLLGLGAPLMPSDGVRLVTEAAAQSPNAAHFLGVLFALGAYVTQDWERALDLLCTSAELGSQIARREIILLSSDRQIAAAAAGREPPTDIWRPLCRAIDVNAWSGGLKGNVLSESPQVVAFPGMVSEDICTWLVSRSRDRLKRARIYLGAAPKVDDYRSNTSAEFDLTESDFVTVLVQMRIASAAGVSLDQLEALSTLHYAQGEQFADHYDFVDPRSPDAAKDVANLGQRVVTFLIYLNEGYSGGETAFRHLGISHKGGVGEGLLFRNVTDDGSPDVRTLHAGLPPRSGEKWVATQFIRGRRIVPGTSCAH